MLWQLADMITELKLGNGTSILITANIASALPASVGAAVQQAADKDSSALPIYALAFFLTTLGIVYVQEVRTEPCMHTQIWNRAKGCTSPDVCLCPC
jgi:preprotein translocase subunit SecY